MARRMETDDTVILSVTNWTNSKASNNADGGVSSLETWLSNKAKRQILASQRSGDVLQIQVYGKDKRSFLHLNTWQWAGTQVNVTEGQLDSAPQGGFSQNNSAPRGPRNQQGGFGQNQNQNQSRPGDLGSRITGGPSNNNFNQNRNGSKDLFEAPNGPKNNRFQQNRQQNGNTNANPFNQPPSNPFSANQNNRTKTLPNQLQEALIEIVRSRYNAGEKFLDLSVLAQDPRVQAAGLTSASTEKFFSALFTVIEEYVFETREKRAEMIHSVSFKGNALNSAKEIIGAGSTFYSVKNLDLSNNNFTNIRDLTWWKNRFPNLEQIILSGNPVDSEDTRNNVRRWYKKLKGYNLTPLDAPLSNGLETTPPVPSPSPIPGFSGQMLTSAEHPEFPPGDLFGQPVPGKPEEQLVKEQLGLRFSYETRLKMKWVEECLVVNNWNYDLAMADLNNALSSGNVPASAFIET